MERAWPLSGRDAELRAIADAVRPGAPTRGVVLVGAAGVGKTRLAREALAAAARRGATVRWAHGTTSSRAFPLGAFAGLVDDPSAEAVAAVPRAIAALTAAAGRVVVGVDDAHLLDDLSSVLVHRLAVLDRAALVLTARDDEPAPDAVTALWKDGYLRLLTLHPLDEAATGSLVSQVLRGPVESPVVRRLWELTRGNPLFLRHLVEVERDAGRLTAASGLWRWEHGPVVAGELALLVRSRIGHLSPAVRDVVDLLALAEPLDLEHLLALADPLAVEEAEQRALVRVDPDGDRLPTRLGHPLYGEVRRAEMGQARARRLRGRIAERLSEERELLPRAVLLLDSDRRPDPALLVRAARSAIGLGDLDLAERLAAAGAAEGGRPARLVHALALSWLSRGEEADALLRDLEASAPDAGARLFASLHRVGNLLWTLRRADEAEALLRGAERSAADAADGAGRQLTAAFRTALDASRGRARRALEVGLPLIASPAAEPITAVLACSGVAAAAAVTGRLDLLVASASQGHEAGRGTAVAIPLFGLSDWQVLGHRLAGDLDPARRVEEDARSLSRSVTGPARWMALVIAGHAAYARGGLRDADRDLTEAWAALGPARHEFRFRCRVLLVAVAALRGRTAEARALLAALEGERHPAYELLRPDDLLARAWVCAAEGATSAAVAATQAAAALAREQDSPAFEVLAWQVAVQLGAPAGPLAHLPRLVGAVQGPRATAALGHARALADADGTALDLAARTWERVGDLVAAADAAAQAAQGHRRAGRRGSAVAAAAAAARLADACGARTPALAAAAAPLPLTAREREIAVLAARGLSNRAIAERLALSVRTVEGHLYRAGHKLGVSDRARLAALLGEPPRSE